MNDRSVTRYGLVGVIVAFVAIASTHALQQPPFAGPDEAAHLGYAHMVADLELPVIDDPMPVPDWATQWQAEVGSAPTPRHTTVWVANHPPLHYVLVAPLVWIAEVAERADGGLLFLRLANVCLAAAGIALTYLLAKELTGRSRIGIGAAAVAALTTQAEVVFGQAMNDGLAFAAGTAVLLAGLRCMQRGTTRRNLLLLGATATIAAGARAATMLLAVAVVAVVAAHCLARADGPRSVRLRRSGRVVACGLLPAVLLFGWFYALNMVRYGDIGASRYLLARFDRVARGGLLSTVVDVDQWIETVRRLMAPTTISHHHPPFMLLVLAVAVVGLVLVVVRATVSRWSIALLVVGVFVTAATFAQHVSAGGGAHPRYLLPALGALATLTVVGLDRLVQRVLPLLLVVAMAWWSLRLVPSGVDPTLVTRRRDRGARAPLLLQVLPTGPFWRLLAGCGIVAGCAVALAAIIWLTVRPDRVSRRRTERPERVGATSSS